ncbi:MAG TPA: hypothetical protein VNK45_02115 [Candidatus Acidoferrales bacterium]|nr:hypothetical protein [Candidatus Acidoferrales bacterium]
MTIVKRIVCLANSRKLNGRCVAGIEITRGNKRVGWIRPVSAREHEEVSEYERQYQDGSDPRVLDVIDVPLIAPKPKDYQQENWLLDQNCVLATRPASDMGRSAAPRRSGEAALAERRQHIQRDERQDCLG